MMMNGQKNTPVAVRLAINLLFAMTIMVLTLCLSHRIRRMKDWRAAPFASWLIVALYLDSMLFTISAMALQDSFPLDESLKICDDAILVCISFYYTTKVVLALFFVEKAHIIRNPFTKRYKSKLYIFNTICILFLPYTAQAYFAFTTREYMIDSDGSCRIGLSQSVLFTVLGYDIFLNIYLNSLFLSPLRKLHSYRHSSADHKLRRMANRTFIGACLTALAAAANLSVAAGLVDEASWLCLMLCNLDVLATVLILHWVTSLDTQSLPNGNSSQLSSQSSPRIAAGTPSQPPVTAADFDRIILNRVAFEDDDEDLATDSIHTPDLAAEKATKEEIERVDLETVDLEAGLVVNVKKWETDFDQVVIEEVARRVEDQGPSCPRWLSSLRIGDRRASSPHFL